MISEQLACAIPTSSPARIILVLPSMVFPRAKSLNLLAGLKRSLDGILPKEHDPLEAYDERVLGSGTFVEQLR